MAKVNFNVENVVKCVCPRCPVQADSKCVKGKKDAFKKIKKNLKIEMLKPEDFPGTYCANGTAACKDIDTSHMCICGTCGVWAAHKLAAGTPQGYFCRDGMVI